MDKNPGKAHTEGLDERVAEIRKKLVSVMSHDPYIRGDEEECIEPDPDFAESNQMTVNFQTLRGLLLRRWMPGITEEEWLELGQEEHEYAQQTVMTYMAREMTLNKHTAGMQTLPQAAKAAAEAARAKVAAANAAHAAKAANGAANGVAKPEAPGKRETGGVEDSVNAIPGGATPTRQPTMREVRRERGAPRADGICRITGRTILCLCSPFLFPLCPFNAD